MKENIKLIWFALIFVVYLHLKNNLMYQEMEKKNITAVIYARVSTNGQDYERQLNDLREHANRMGYDVVKEFAEKISGAKKVAEREALTELLSFVEAHNVDKVLIYECSRLSRRVADFIKHRR